MVKDYSLVIKDVAEEDAGNYTIILSIRQWNLSKNLTVSLTVNGKFATCSHASPEHINCCQSCTHQSIAGFLTDFMDQNSSLICRVKYPSLNQKMDTGFH